jgi:hAT family C-terminal dimerisation region
LLTCPQDSSNIFDALPALAAPKQTELRDELERYLSTDPEYVGDVLQWWYERKATFPRLSRMALDYLSLLGEFSFVALIISTNYKEQQRL